MRISNLSYGQRSDLDKDGKLEPKVRFFIACEGRRTEYQYFKGIDRNKSDIGINYLVEIIPIDHDSKKSENHPLQVYAEAKKAINEYDNYFPNNGDQLCLIVDRDKHSFSDSQYDELLKYEHEGEFALYVSNPCFEFWLLLHFSDCKHLDQNKLNENAKSDNKRTLTENLLRDYLGGSYNKSRLKYKFDKYFKDNVKTAINNAKKYATTTNQLKYSVGTNVGKLIETMLNQH